MNNNYNIKNWGKEQRMALARIVFDLIMADKIIDNKEVAMFTNLFGQKDNRPLFHHAQELTFAQAIKLLAKYPDETSHIVNEIANSDGFCAPAEATLLLAIDYFLRKNNAKHYTKYDIQSFKLTDIFIGKRFILYVDNNANSKFIEIEKHYDLIVNLLASIDFQFIYIPKIVEQYKSLGLGKFKSLATYIFPDIPEDKVENIFDNIVTMNTKSFVKDYLNEKLSFDISYSSPSLMVMLGRSSVIGKNISETGMVYETHANFLKINIGEEKVLDIINEIVHDFNNLVTFNFHFDFNPAKNKLLYHGIHKVFFRLVALAKKNPMRYNINVNTRLGKIFINDKILDLQPGITAIYILILCRSFFGDRKGLPMIRIFNDLTIEEQTILQIQYERICTLLSNKKTQRKPLYPNVQNRISMIKNAIDDIVEDKFIGHIQISSGDYIQTLVSPENVTIDGLPIKEHPDWNSII